MRRSLALGLPVAFAGFALTACEPAVVPPTESVEYAVVPLAGTEHADSSWTSGINATGHIAGALCLEGCRPAVWRDGAVMVLSAETGRASGVNDRGDVVGEIGIEGFVWRDGELEVIPVDRPWEDVAYRPQDIGEDGTIVGYYVRTAAPSHPLGFRVVEGAYEEFPFAAHAINRDGMIVGHHFRDAANPAPHRWIDGDVEGFSEFVGHTYDVNDAGEAAGLVHLDGSDGFIWMESGLSLLAPLPGFDRSVAHGISNDRVAVGQSYTLAHDEPRATVWRAPEEPRDLSVLADGAWLIETARAVNDAGEIAAVARRDETGPRQAVMLRPLP